MEIYLEKVSAIIRYMLGLRFTLKLGRETLLRSPLLMAGLVCAVGLTSVTPAVQGKDQQSADWEAGSDETAHIVPAADYDREDNRTIETGSFSELDEVISLQLDNHKLAEALEYILETSELDLVYGNHPVLFEKEVTLDLEDVTVQDAIEEVVRDTGLELMHSPSGRLVLSRVDRSQMQSDGTVAPMILEGAIAGTVTDSETGEPIPGVNVVIAGTTQGSTTNTDGEYTIDGVEAGVYDLEASFVGYTSATEEDVEVVDGETTEVNFALEESTHELEDVVVTALGVEREERSLTYGTQGLDAAQVAEAREMNVANSLAGQVSGMSVTQSATGVSGEARVILRGNRSISGSSQPLYVVDGVPVRGGISDLNPDDIEDISVLKGPNAAALYGSDAQDGAIVITTRRGEEGGVSVRFRQNVMAQAPILLTDYQNEYGQGTGGEYSSTSEFNWGPSLDGQMVDSWSPNPEYDGEEYAFSPQPNNVDDVYRTGYNSSTNFEATAGTESVQGIFSYSFTNGQGIVPGNDMERHNVSARVSSQLTERLSLDSRLSYVRRTINNQLSTGENFSNPIRHISRLPRNIRTEDAENFEYFTEDEQQLQHFWNPGSNGGANPYWTINRNLSLNNRDRVVGFASLTYNFTEALSLMVRGSYDGLNSDSESKLYNDTYIIADNGSYSISRSNALEWNGDFLLTYAQDLSEDWYIDANVGGNIKQRRDASMSANTGDALTVPNFFTISNTQNVEASQSIGSPMDVHSLYTSGQIGWRDAIYLDVTGRNDWSSTLPADNRSYFYPSVGLSAIITELLPASNNVFDFARVRASWARVGSPASPFSTQRTASFSSGGNNGFLQLSTVLPNEDLLPEQTESIELGADVRFFQNRLGLDVTAYQTNTGNQLFTVSLPVGSGASSFYTNGGNVENRGLELTLTTTPVETSALNWDVDFNFAVNRNMVREISEERPILTITTDFLRAFRIEEGEPFGQVYSRGWERDDEGRVVVRDNGLPAIEDGMNVPVANFNPDWTGSIQSSVSWRNLSASFLIDHRQGGTIASLTNAILFADGLPTETLEGRDGGLVFGENLFGDETAVREDGSPNDVEIDAETFWRAVGGRNAPVGEAFVDEATNTRLRELTLGYTMPETMMERLPISTATISLVGRNLFFLYRASNNLDPDLMVGTGASAEGFESFTPPSTRSYGINLSVSY